MEVNVKINMDNILRAYWEDNSQYNIIDTETGKKIDFLKIDPEEINLEDVAIGLSNTCRFAGQLDRFYSVAEHSILVSMLVEKLMPVELNGVIESAFMHDAAEAYLGDVPTPLKVLCPGFRKIEEAFESAVGCRFGLTIGFRHPMIKEADMMLFEAERELFRGVPKEDRMHTLPDGIEIRNLAPKEALKEFMKRAEVLGIKERDVTFATITP